jgi:undecaprenyl-diphosphatase
MNTFWQEIHKADQLITLEINSWDSPITDPIWQFFSDKLVWAPMYAAIIALLIWKLGWKRGLMVLAGALLTFGFCDQFSNLVKHAVERIRPLHDEFMVSNGLNILEKGGGFSFFSAHSANSFGLAFSTFLGMKLCLRNSGSTIVPKWLKAYGIWMFFWATMVAVSRIFVGKHYLGDVIVGIIVGSIAGIAFGWLASYIAHKTAR